MIEANGDVHSAAHWSCTLNQDLLPVGPDGARAGLVWARWALRLEPPQCAPPCSLIV